ncbi:MAG TPA: WXG100 family type VII secretion target [Caldilineaceae bacterium]|nr:WXG100 family type VII secretion target [Caldilineaceae bacterium]
MSEEVIRVDYQALEQVAGKFGTNAQNITQLLKEIQRAYTPLKNGGWIGRGAAAFFTEMESEILPATMRLSTALLRARDVTIDIRDTLRAAEEEAARPFQGQGDSVNTHDAATGRQQSIAQSGSIQTVQPRDYALMSQAAYDDGALPQELRNKGWQKLQQYSTNTGYSGTVYLNERTKEIVFAHRGTNPELADIIDGTVQTAIYASPVAQGVALVTGQSIDQVAQRMARAVGINTDGSDLDDDAQLAMGKVPDQYYESRAFVQRSLQQMQAQGYEGYTVTHTGHSLGGALADIHAAAQNQRAITFDNPGSKEPLESINQQYNPENHISYQSHPNLINQTNGQVGHVTHIRLNTQSDKFGIIRDTLHDHSLDNIVDAMNPETGRPYRLNEDVL